MLVRTATIGVIFLNISSAAYALNPGSRADCDYVLAQSQRCPSPDQCPKVVAFLNQCAANFSDDDNEDDAVNTAPPPPRQQQSMPTADNDPVLRQSQTTHNMIENPGGMSMQQSFDLAKRCDHGDQQACAAFDTWKQRMNQQGQTTEAITKFYERGAIAAGDSARIAKDDLRRQTEIDAQSSKGWADWYGHKAENDSDPVDRNYDERYRDQYTDQYQTNHDWLNHH